MWGLSQFSAATDNAILGIPKIRYVEQPSSDQQRLLCGRQGTFCLEAAEVLMVLSKRHSRNRVGMRLPISARLHDVFDSCGLVLPTCTASAAGGRSIFWVNETSCHVSYMCCSGSLAESCDQNTQASLIQP